MDSLYAGKGETARALAMTNFRSGTALLAMRASHSNGLVVALLHAEPLQPSAEGDGVQVLPGLSLPLIWWGEASTLQMSTLSSTTTSPAMA